LAVVVVDGLAEVRETCGQARADELLKAVGALVLQTARESDLVARCKENAFAIVLPQTMPSGAEAFCQRLLAAARRDAPLGRDLEIRTGAAAAVGDDDAAALLARAETAAMQSLDSLAAP
jgi:GGDEF domain-containing protein